MKKPYDRMTEKTRTAFDGRNLGSPQQVEPARRAIAGALAAELGPLRANEIAFHLLDWAADAAFLVALCLDSKSFTQKEVAAGVGVFLVHAPAHVLAAARLSGNSTEDIFAEPTVPSRRPQGGGGRSPRRRRGRRTT